MKFYYLFILLSLFVFSQCSNELPKTINQRPVINISYDITDSELTILGSIEDSDGQISKSIINWGDNNIIVHDSLNYAQFELKHKYSIPKSYTIQIIAIDTENDSSFYNLEIDMTFIPEQINGIKTSMLKTDTNEYLVLTINLHTYQESEQDKKFDLLVDLIGIMDVDFIALQECAQHKSAPIITGIIREDNMALILSNKLKEKYNVNYNYIWNWSHYGWDVWEEGVAILSKHPLLDSEDKYISSSKNKNNILSRKVIYGSYEINKAKLNVFSAHTHWRTSQTDHEQNKQILNIKNMASDKLSSNNAISSFICGDFNGNPTSDYPWSEGYNTMMNENDYLDSFLEIYTDANNKPAKSIYNTVGGSFPGRIDYIFNSNNGKFRIIDAQIVFTNQVIGIISDHNGVLTKLKYIE